MNIGKFLRTAFFIEYIQLHPSISFRNQKQCGMVSTKKVGRSGQSGTLYIIRRNHSNTLLLINLQKTKTCPMQNTAAKPIC